MLLDELVRCLEVLQGRIQSHTAALQRNEAQTRLALIDPLLERMQEAIVLWREVEGEDAPRPLELVGVQRISV